MIDHSYVYGPSPDASQHPTALILLNHEGRPSTPSDHLSPFVQRLWSSSTLHLCADGAASRLYHSLRGSAGTPGSTAGATEGPLLLPPSPLQAYQPDEIVGDWDSIDAESEGYYRGVGVAMYPEPEDQDSTDLEKCFRRVVARQGGPGGGVGKYRVIVAGAFGGRLDHEIQNLNCLYKWSHAFHALAMVTEHSIASLLPSGGVEVRVCQPFEGPTCGILPLGGPVTLTTVGLQWDVVEAESRFGGMVSTSNCTLGTTVTVHASAPVIWTINVKPMS